LILLDRQSLRFRRVVKALALFILGAVLAGAAELPFGGWLQIPILALVWLTFSKSVSQSIKKNFVAGMAFGLGYFVTGLWWIYISLHDVGGMNAALSCAAIFLLSVCLSFYFSAACQSIFLFKHSQLKGLLLASAWVAMEYLRGSLFTGFPWMGLAEAQFNGPFAPIATYFGGLSCTFLVIWSSWELTQIKTKPYSSSLYILGMIGVCQLAGLWTFTKPIGEPLSVRLIQGNFAQSLKFNPRAIQDQMRYYTSEITAKSADLIVTPETALPWPQSNLPIGMVAYLRDFANTHSSNILLGLIGEVETSKGMQYTNRATGLSPDSPMYQYDKAHLVPFGEFIPLGFHWFVNAFHVPLSDFAHGSLDQAPYSIQRKGQEPINAAITICYEDVFGNELAGRIRNSDPPANLLINMTNLAWFGDSQAPTQQLRLSQLRSLETGLPSLRATNTGITAVLGPNGALQTQLPQFTQATLQTQVQAYSGKTPYVIWGNIPILSVSCLLLLFGFIRQRRFW